MMKRVSVINPFDQSLVEEISLDSRSDAFLKLDRAYQLFRNSSNWLTKEKRRDVLEKVKTILESKRDQIIDTAISEGGKPYKDTVIEFERGLNGIDVAISELFHFKGEVVNMELNAASMHRHAYTIKEPRGVVLAISAFNHPFNLIIHQVIPCIVTGCPVLIKPTLKTPLTCKIVVDALYQAGLDEGFCQYLPVDNDVAEALVSDERVSFLSFIGSARVGWYLRTKLAPGAHCALEHGGLAPVILDHDVDWQEIMPKLLRSSFYHAGQVCVKTQRIYVPEPCAQDFVSQFKQRTLNLRVGNPKDPDTDVGPIISQSELSRIEEWVNESIAHGAKLICGGKRILKTCYEPTIIFDPKLTDKISTEEIFGPVVAVYPYKKLSEAIELANDTKYFFQAAIFTKNIDHAFVAANKLYGRTVLINDHSAFRVDWMPFGGHRRSGLGVGGIGYAMKDLAIDKLLIFNFNPDAS
ncbi:MAG TPA: aldehyde dehydrogenase family protein [Myxococcota bacterium]|nr:aldehyde dehydrogenase family protein [Myxococcota bacterium]